MRKLLRISFVITFILTVFSASAQQIPNSNQYLVNRYLLSPSYAGYDQKSKVYIGYRNSWSGFQDAPKTSLISAFIPASDRVWLGAQIISDKAGVFDNLYAQFSYTYHLEVGYDQMIYFGMWASMFQNKITLGNLSLDTFDDPILIGQSELTGFSVNAGASILYNWRKGYIGVSIPYLFSNKDIYVLSDAKNVVELYKQIIGHASYKFRINYDLEIEPFLVYRWIKDFDSQIDFSLLFIYRENYWIGLTYRDIGKTAVSFGSHFTKDFTFNYTFEFVTKSYLAQPSSTHEFTLGFTLPIGDGSQRNYWKRNYKGSSRR